ncbi:MAG TPA: PAS domain-containing sensor histidine kinase [Xanthobacteraceae bacterium]|nr:PAS domain-containing sensor histidine kinase [Xanthobacteraceae bacterium]
MSFVLPVREYIESLVHVSARSDLLAAARHRSFIAPRILGGFLALGVLPVYLLARGTLGVLEAAVIVWFFTPIAIACFLSRTGRYEQAHILSSLALTALVTLIAAVSGGISSPAAIWLVLVPMEAALSTSRRVVLVATGFVLAGAAALLAFSDAGLSLIPPSTDAVPPLLAGLSLASATLYAALLAFGVESFARTGSTLLNREEERYKLLALNMTDVISLHGRNGIVLFVSPAAERLFGVPPVELLAHGLFDRIHVADRPIYLTTLADAAAGKGDCSAEFRVRRTLQTEAGAVQFVWLEMRCRAVAAAQSIDNQKKSSDVVTVMRDVTERKAQEQTVAEARSEAEQANAAKSRFLATMSHELRTPLNAVIGFSEMLMNEAELQIDAARRHDYSRLIHDSGQHLLSVVNLILDMSKLETGNFVITPEPFAPAVVIRNCCDLLALKAHESGLDIVVRMPDLPEMVGDKRALKQMLFNLLSNAIKFTDRGGRVIVTAALDGAHLAITIEDTGVGISADDLPRIGDPFFQARGAYDRPHEGTGLGLSIVKGLVDLHGGDMQVESRVGVGTRVTIRLPLDCENGHAHAKTVIALNAGARRDEMLAPALLADGAEREVKKSA